VPIAVSDVPETGEHLELSADADTRASIARLVGLRSLPRLEASFDVRAHDAGGVHVIGQVRATVGQTCVVTLEPIENEVIEAVDVLLVPAGAAKPAQHGDEELQETERLVGGTVDLGAMATEFLVLGVDPYPRRGDAVFQAPVTHESSGSAFAPLAALKSESGKKGG
jgi:hypothetical protein